MVVLQMIVYPFLLCIGLEINYESGVFLHAALQKHEDNKQFDLAYLPT